VVFPLFDNLSNLLNLGFFMAFYQFVS
jgi:hypothetical protein